MYGDAKLTLGGASSVLTVADGGSLTINAKNVVVAKAFTVNKGGKFVLNATNVTATTNGLATVAGELTVGANTTVDSTGHVAIDVLPNSTVTLNGKVDATTVVRPASSYNKGYNEADAKVIVNGGTYTTTATAIQADKGMNVTINGGTFNTKPGEGAPAVNVIMLYNAKVTINGGTLTSNGAPVQTEGTADTASLTVNGGTLVSTLTGRHALLLRNAKAKYVLAGGTYEAKGDKDAAAISLDTAFFDVKTGKLIADQKDIITGGRYLNNIIGVIKNTVSGANYDATDDLVAEGYTVKEEGNYKVVVSTKAEDNKKPAAKPEEQAPNTYDAGLVYMGLALSAIGASVVSVRKLRNLIKNKGNKLSITNN